MPDPVPNKKPDRVPDISRETANTPEGHRMLVWLWVIGLILLSGAIWGIAYLSTYLQPPQHTNGIGM